MSSFLPTDDSGVYQEHDFVLVEATSGETLRVGFGSQKDGYLTLAELRQKVAAHFFPCTQKSTSPNALPVQVRLLWCGKEIQPGVMWHCGKIPMEDQITMKDLNPGCKNGEPKILVHATGGTDYIDDSEDDSDDDDENSGGNQVPTGSGPGGRVKYTHSAI